jgi:lysophospholipase L1-like esterase
MQPLRAVAAWQGRRVGAAERAAATQAGAVTVDLAALTGAAFRNDQGLLASDGYHPSAAGYALWAQVLAPKVATAAGVRRSGPGMPHGPRRYPQ